MARAAVADLSLPVGFRFHPTEEELISHYLQMKLLGMDYLVSDVIREINICNYEPWDLPAFSLIQSDDEEWYFFSRLIYKKNKRNQAERATNKGFWKITGQEKPVKARKTKAIIGKKRILTFYLGVVRKAQKTNWVVHEYYIPQSNPNADQRDFVLCHVKKKSGENTDVATCDEGASDFEYQQQLAQVMDIEEEHTQPQQNPDYFQSEMGRMLANSRANDDYPRLQFPFVANEADDNFGEFLNSVIVDYDQDSSGEIPHANVFNDTHRPQSVRKMYFEDGGVSSDTDTEVQHGQFQSLVTRREEGVMLRNQSLGQAASSINVLPEKVPVQSVTAEHSGTHQRIIRQHGEARPINALNLKNGSSVDMDAESFSINCIQLAPDEYYSKERTRRRTYPTSAPVTLGKLTEVKQQQSKAKEATERRAAVDLSQKKKSITKSNEEAEVVKGNNAEKGMKQTQNATTAGNWKGCSFISWETTPPLTRPRSVYIFNTVLGAIMFPVFAREAVLYGQWC